MQKRFSSRHSTKRATISFTKLTKHTTPQVTKSRPSHCRLSTTTTSMTRATTTRFILPTRHSLILLIIRPTARNSTSPLTTAPPRRSNTTIPSRRLLLSRTALPLPTRCLRLLHGNLGHALLRNQKCCRRGYPQPRCQQSRLSGGHGRHHLLRGRGLRKRYR